MPKYTFETKMPIVACRFCPYRIIISGNGYKCKCKIDEKSHNETHIGRPKDCPLKESEE